MFKPSGVAWVAGLLFTLLAGGCASGTGSSEASGSSGGDGTSSSGGSGTTSSSSSGGQACTAGLNTAVIFPDSYPENAELLRKADGTLLMGSHQTTGDTSYVVRRAPGGTWSSEAIPLPPNRDGFGVFLANVLDAQERLHVAGTFRTGATRELWHVVESGGQWTHHLVEPSFDVLNVRVGHAAGATWVAYSGTGARVVRVPDDGTPEASVQLQGGGQAVIAVATHASGEVVILTAQGEWDARTASIHRLQSNGTWTRQALAASGVWAVHAALEDSGEVRVFFQRSPSQRFDDLAVMRVSTSGQILETTTVEASTEMQVADVTTARSPTGALQLAYERHLYRVAPARKDLVVATERSSGNWDVQTVLENHSDDAHTRGPLLLDGTTLHRVVSDPGNDRALLHRVVCF